VRGYHWTGISIPSSSPLPSRITEDRGSLNAPIEQSNQNVAETVRISIKGRLRYYLLLQQYYYCDCVIMIYIYLYYPRPGLSDQLFELNGSLLPMRLTFF
jgi:hypothetical protein